MSWVGRRPGLIGRWLVVVAVLLVPLLVGAPDAAPEDEVGAGTWAEVEAMPRPRSEFGAAVIDGWIYVAGGIDGEQWADRFDPASGTWEELPDLPAGAHHPAVTALGGVLYVIGGYARTGPATDAVWAYDPAVGSWQARAPLPEKIGALGAAAVGDRIYAVGGARERLSGPVSGAVWAYDPAADAWEERASLRTPREHLAVVAGGEKVYALGGRANRSDAPGIAAMVEEYDPVGDSWTQLPGLPTPRAGLAGAYLDGLVIVLGGETFETFNAPTTHAEVEAFDPATREWAELAPLPTPRHGLAAAVVGGALYAIAGSTEAGAAVNTGMVERLTLDAGEASPAASPGE